MTAASSVIVNIARLVWAFDIKQDPKHPVDIRAWSSSHVLCTNQITRTASSVDNFTPGFLSAPKEFKCLITPRDIDVKNVVTRQFEEARAVYERFED